MANNKDIHALDDTVIVTVRASNYRALTLNEGLKTFLEESATLPSEQNTILISNFASFVSRTLDVKLVEETKNELANAWVNLWQMVKKQQYELAFFEYLELSAFTGDNLSEVWDETIEQANDPVIIGDSDLAPPETLSDEDKRDPKKKISA